jgi:DNA-binding response OmpR family regulator
VRARPLTVPTVDLNVLAVDDETICLRGLRRVFGRRFRSLDTAASADEALRALEKKRYDAVILDVVMPERDGIACCALMRERYPWLAIVMLSGYDRTDDKVDAFTAGADDYLSKSCDSEELFARIIARAVGRRLMDRGAARQSAPSWSTPSEQSALEAESDGGGDQIVEIKATLTEDPHSFAVLRVDGRSETVWVNDEERKLDPAEYASLSQLLAKRGRIVRISELTERPGHHISEETLRSRISLMRKKLYPAGSVISVSDFPQLAKSRI